MRIKLILGLALLYSAAGAQTWSIPAKSGALQMGVVVYIESIYQHTGAVKGADTLSGTGFLIADSNKVYLVTAKHIIQQLLPGKNQQLANNNLFISATWERNDKGTKILNLSNWAGAKRPFIFSSDEEDIAIISLQKNKYKPVLVAMLRGGRKPVSIDSIDKSNDHYTDEPFFHPFFIVFKNKNGIKERHLGLAPGKIKSFDEKYPLFTTNETVAASFSGSPIFINDKIAGVFIYKEGLTNNAAIIREPFHNAKSGTAAKASGILPLLKKLQENENTPGFN